MTRLPSGGTPIELLSHVPDEVSVEELVAGRAPVV